MKGRPRRGLAFGAGARIKSVDAPMSSLSANVPSATLFKVKAEQRARRGRGVRKCDSRTTG